MSFSSVRCTEQYYLRKLFATLDSGAMEPRQSSTVKNIMMKLASFHGSFDFVITRLSRSVFELSELRKHGADISAISRVERVIQNDIDALLGAQKKFGSKDTKKDVEYLVKVLGDVNKEHRFAPTNAPIKMINKRPVTTLPSYPMFPLNLKQQPYEKVRKKSSSGKWRVLKWITLLAGVVGTGFLVKKLYTKIKNYGLPKKEKEKLFEDIHYLADRAKKLEGTGKKVIKIVKEVKTKIGNGVSHVVDAVKGGGNKLKDKVVSVVTNAKYNAFVAVPQSIEFEQPSVKETIKGYIETGKKVKAKIGNGVSHVVNAVKGGGNKLKDKVVSVVTNAKKNAVATIANTKDWANGKVYNAFVAVPQPVVKNDDDILEITTEENLPAATSSIKDKVVKTFYYVSDWVKNKIYGTPVAAQEEVEIIQVKPEITTPPLLAIKQPPANESKEVKVEEEQDPEVEAAMYKKLAKEYIEKHQEDGEKPVYQDYQDPEELVYDVLDF